MSKDGLCAIITGSASGLGAATAAILAKGGARGRVRRPHLVFDLIADRFGTEDAAARRYLDKINTSGHRMRLLVRDILAYSEVTESAPGFMSVDLRRVVHELLGEFDLLIEQKRARIAIAGLPTVNAIPLQMQQLFGNLISNALKYAKAGVPPLIEITAEEVADRWHIQVADNGIGFDPQYAEKIFSIFSRLHSKSDYTGTGIGLAICQKIVENHHGEIYATAKPGEGAIFHVLLPA